MLTLPIIKCKMCELLYDEDSNVVNPNAELSFKCEALEWTFGDFHTKNYISTVNAEDVAENGICNECQKNSDK